MSKPKRARPKSAGEPELSTVASASQSELARPSTAWVIAAVAAVAIGLAYANHFDNTFHFDDHHVIQNNPDIRQLANIPRFFTGDAMFSVLAPNRTYRPLLSATLAIDYAIADGLTPRTFQVHSFLWFVAQLVLMVLVFRRLLAPLTPYSTLLAIAATAFYGVHPVNAETVNYICQRSDIISAVAAVLGLILFMRKPQAWGWHLVAMLLGCLGKQTTVMFAPTLAVYVYLFTDGSRMKRADTALRMAWPALLLAGVFYIVQGKLTPSTFSASDTPAWQYALTQPWVIAHYFRSFFAPDDLSADSDWEVVTGLGDPRVWLGIGFLTLFALVVRWCARRDDLRVAAFGLAWFVLALLPTSSVVPLAEPMNDHRMYYPFVGLTLALAAAVHALLLRGRSPERAIRTLLVCLIPVAMLGVYMTVLRNQVWKTEESLWFDTAKKSPKNGRGLMNYGLSQMAVGRYEIALDYFERARQLLPQYANAEVNIAIAQNGLGRPEAEIESHFKRAVTLSVRAPIGHTFYASWLTKRKRYAEAISVLEQGLKVDRASYEIYTQLMANHEAQGDWAKVASTAKAGLTHYPNNTELQRRLHDAEQRTR